MSTSLCALFLSFLGPHGELRDVSDAQVPLPDVFEGGALPVLGLRVHHPGAHLPDSMRKLAFYCAHGFITLGTFWNTNCDDSPNLMHRGARGW